MSSRGLGVGLIGSGFMGKCHALAWLNVAAVFGDVAAPRLVALADASPDLAAQKAREFGFASSTGAWRDLLQRDDIDIISITTPNEFHPDMAIAALQAGKHVWCEKPMATSIAAAQAMNDAAKAAGKTAALGYNYIQNPLIRHVKTLLKDKVLGDINHVRFEMDEDYMADPLTPFTGRSATSAGYGALDDFGVHPLSLILTLLGKVRLVFGDMRKPYATRPDGSGTRAVDNFDIATALMELEGGAQVTLSCNRSAWGRKGRIFMQIFGDKGTLVYDQERLNEVQLFVNDGPTATQGFRTIISGPAHVPYGKFVPAPGHQLGFNDLKTIECREVLRAVAGEPAHLIGFEQGLHIEATVHAIARAAAEGRWLAVS